MFKYCRASLLILMFFILGQAAPIYAAAPSFEYESGDTNLATATGLGDQDPIVIAIYAVNWALGILGFFALVLFLYGGFVWMNARGREDEVTKAKDIIKAAVIGLVIILASYGISSYVYNKISDISTTSMLPLPFIESAQAVSPYSPEGATFEINGDDISSGTQLGTQNPVLLASYIINWALTLLGVFFLALTIYAGFVWMNARGREDEVEKAKEIIKAAVIGLVIILASYGLTTYIFRVVYNISLAGQQ